MSKLQPVREPPIFKADGPSDGILSPKTASFIGNSAPAAPQHAERIRVLCDRSIPLSQLFWPNACCHTPNFTVSHPQKAVQFYGLLVRLTKDRGSLNQ
jgi:hypothetical protein